MAADSPTGSRCVDVIQPSSQHSSGSAPAVGGGADVPGHGGGASQPALPLRVADDHPLGGAVDVAGTEGAGGVDGLTLGGDTADPAASSPSLNLSQPDAASDVIGPGTASHIADHHDVEDAVQAAALTAADEAVGLQSTPAAVTHLVPVSNAEDLVGVDTDREHVPTSTNNTL